MGKGGEVVILGVPRRLSEAEAGEEGPSAKKMRAAKTKKVKRRLPRDYVDFVLAMVPKEPARYPHLDRVSEECRHQSAIQEYYRRELDTKGYVEVEEEVQVSDSYDGF